MQATSSNLSSCQAACLPCAARFTLAEGGSAFLELIWPIEESALWTPLLVCQSGSLLSALEKLNIVSEHIIKETSSAAGYRQIKYFLIFGGILKHEHGSCFSCLSAV